MNDWTVFIEDKQHPYTETELVRNARIIREEVTEDLCEWPDYIDPAYFGSENGKRTMERIKQRIAWADAQIGC